MSATIAWVRGFLFLLHPKRLLALVAGVLGGLLYVWFAAVRAVPEVRRRKAAMRGRWRNRKRVDRAGDSLRPRG
jgi:hypothetical protein